MAASRPLPKFGYVGPWPAPKYICHLLTAAPHPRQLLSFGCAAELGWEKCWLRCQRAIKDDQCASTRSQERLVRRGSSWRNFNKAPKICSLTLHLAATCNRLSSSHLLVSARRHHAVWTSCHIGLVGHHFFSLCAS